MDNKNRKSLFIVLCIFAAIGVLAIIGGAVFLGMRITEKRYENASVTPEVQEVVVEKPIEETKTDVNELIIHDSEEQINKNQQQGEIKEATVPEAAASAVAEEVNFGDDKLQIVYFGDSIFDFHRDDGTSIPKLTSDILNANYINLAMGGTCASINIDNKWDNENWDSTSGAGMAKAAAGLVNPDVFLDCTAKELVKAHQGEFSQTDIFVIEYGINDFLAHRPLDDMDNLANPTTYNGALKQMILACQTVAPNAFIVLCKPSYCEFWGKDGMYLGNTYVMSNDNGVTLFDYGGKVDCVDDPDKGIFAFDTNVDNGINIYSAEECLEDGIHLTQAGREKYSQMLSDFIIKNVPGVKEYLGIESTEE